MQLHAGVPTSMPRRTAIRQAISTLGGSLSVKTQVLEEGDSLAEAGLPHVLERLPFSVGLEACALQETSRQPLIDTGV